MTVPRLEDKPEYPAVESFETQHSKVLLPPLIGRFTLVYG
jgi:hypothetical protein